MDFAKRQLEKYGWSEGEGLGKHSTGIKTALKPKIKLNTAGIGHDPAKEFTHRWWEDAFNDAASNINIERTADGVKVETKTQDFPEISSIQKSKVKRDKMKYGAFLKRETLTNDGSILAPEDKSDTVEDADNRLLKLPPTLSDEQLFQACGGLTAHKAARHGHKLSGKLKRVEEQEAALLMKQNTLIQSSSCASDLNHDSDKSKKRKKKKRCDDIQVESTEILLKPSKRKTTVCSNEDEINELQELNSGSKKKKKKKDKR